MSGLNLPLALLALTLACWLSSGPAPSAAAAADLVPEVVSHTEWLAASLREMQAVKPGATREDVLKVFQEEGGLSTRTTQRYAYRGCPFIKVDVTFEAVEAAGDKPAKFPKDRVTKVSKPFVKRPIVD